MSPSSSIKEVCSIGMFYLGFAKKAAVFYGRAMEEAYKQSDGHLLLKKPSVRIVGDGSPVPKLKSAIEKVFNDKRRRFRGKLGPVRSMVHDRGLSLHARVDMSDGTFTGMVVYFERIGTVRMGTRNRPAHYEWGVTLMSHHFQ